MRLKLAQLSRDIERQKIQAYNVSLRAPAVDSDELFSIFNSPPRHEEETPAVDSGERNRAQSVSHRYKNHVGSTDALNSSPGNDLQQVGWLIFILNTSPFLRKQILVGLY